MKERKGYVLDLQGCESVNAVEPVAASFFFREPVPGRYRISFHINRVRGRGEKGKYTSRMAKLPNVLEPSPLTPPHRLD